jgi:lysophospholipase L1-like esterase
VIGPRLVACLALVIGLAGSACSSSDSSDSRAGAQLQPSAPASVATTTTVAPLVADEPPLVAMLGDSNSYLAIPELEASFADVGIRSTIRGISGSGLKDLETDWAPAAAQIRASPPTVVVVALGTNDAGEPQHVAAFRQELEQLLAELGDVPVVWVTHTEGGVRHSPDAERAVNDEIRAAPHRHPNVTVLDLQPRIDADDELLDDDGLHFSPAGAEWYADRIAEAAAARAEAAAGA